MIHRTRKNTELNNVDRSNNKKKPVFISQKNIKNLQNLTKTAKVEVIYINLDGDSHDLVDDSVAKQVKYLKGSKYYVLIGRNNKLFNPSKNQIHDMSSKGRKTVPEFEMREVTKDCYDKYLKFLSGKNHYQLGQAEIARGR